MSPFIFLLFWLWTVVSNIEKRTLLLPIIVPLGLNEALTFISKCPRPVDDWFQKAEELRCDTAVKLRYHCILDSKGRLLEDCLTPMYIPAKQEGCPFVVVKGDGNAIFHALLSDCPRNNSQCPQWNHTGYWSNEIFRFPSCQMNISDRFAGQHDANTDDDSDVNDGGGADMCTIHTKHYILVFCVLIISGFVVGGTFMIIVILLRRREERKLNGVVQGQGEEMPLNGLDKVRNHFVLLETVFTDNIYILKSKINVMPCLKRSKDNNCEYCKITDPLMFAAHCGSETCVSHLVDVMENVEVKDKLELNLIHNCIIYDWPKVLVDTLLTCPNLLHENGSRNGQPFFLINSAEEEKAIQKFLLDYKSKVDSSTEMGSAQDFWQDYREKLLQRGLDVLLKKK